MRKILVLLLCFILFIGLLPMTVSASEIEITSANITITPPVGGKLPDLSAVSSDPQKYYADVDDWGLMAYGTVTPASAVEFKTHERYELRVIFRAKSGYTFAEDCVFTINGGTTGCYSKDGNEFRYTYLYAADPTCPTYTVTFNKNDGSNTTDSIAGVFDNYKLPSCMFTAPVGKYFAGWSVNSYLKDPDDTINVLENTTVYASWKDIPASGYTVTFDANGGTGNMSKATNRYGEYTLPECGFTAPSGKRFAGWSIWPGNYGIEPSGRKIIVWKDTTLTAIWEDIPLGANVIKSANYDVTEPFAGATSKAGIVSTTSKYSVSLGWSTTKDGSNLNDFNNKTFEAGKTYYLDINLVSKDPYTFAEGASVYVNGKKYTAVWTMGSSYTKYISVYDIPFTVPSQTDTHTHSPSAWRTNQVYHYKVCTTCGDFLTQEDHSGGIATCNQKGKCTVCGFAYIEENENHNPDTTKWIACGNLYHAHLCKDCGAHAITEDHNPGPAATETQPQKCTVCGYIIVPAKNHKHKLTKVAKIDATCTKPGNVEYYTCDGCSDFFADKGAKTKIDNTVIAPLGHNISDDWNYDENNHWRICTVCKEVLAETQLAHETESEKCTTCGYDGTTIKTEPNTYVDSDVDINNDNNDKTGSDNLETDELGQSDNNYKNSSLWIWIALIAIIVIGAIAATIIIYKKKGEKHNEKENFQFNALFGYGNLLVTYNRLCCCKC